MKGATMEPEERKKVMDGLFCWLPDQMRPRITPEELEAIRECDKLARAWDELYREATKRTVDGGVNWPYLVAKMDQLLSPTPKDPLEELEAFVRLNQEVRGESRWKLGYIKMDCLLAEIRRLRAEGKK